MAVKRMRLETPEREIDIRTVKSVRDYLLKLTDGLNSEGRDYEFALHFIKCSYTLTGTHAEGDVQHIEFDVGDIAAVIIYDERTRQFSLYDKCTVFKKNSMECVDNIEWFKL